MTHKETYRQFCKTAEDLPVFAQAWYLDVVCQGGDWEVILVEKGGEIAATLPYFLKRKGPIQYVTMPHLTKFLGPYILPKYRQTKHEARLLRQLIEQLPKLSYFKQNFHYNYTNWLPFYWQGFRQQTHYSYRLTPLDDLQQIYAGISADYRNQKIAKASDVLQMRFDLPMTEFYRVAALSYQRQQMPFPFSEAYLKNLITMLEQYEAGKVFYAVDQDQKIHSTALLLWDKTSSYLSIIGDDPAFRSQGGGIWLAWQLIQYTSQELKLPTFDFLGSMIEPIERVRRQFGAQQTPYHAVWKYSAWWWEILDVLRKR
ncbi:MAG: GNAT family N-acetyltransferase [Saprospiraceae bacterium]|nr:GNAT family N-acetyltransferase [Saprospiraceae bacterium]